MDTSEGIKEKDNSLKVGLKAVNGGRGLQFG